MENERRYDHAALETLASALLVKAGMDTDKAADVAGILVEGDLMGFTTHGLAQLPAYLGSIESGTMQVTGEPDVVSDFGAVQVLAGKYLPGPWLVKKALNTAVERAEKFGQGCVTVRESHHIAALSSYLHLATSKGHMVMISSSDPSASFVAPFGGRDAVFTPDPIAVGIPTTGDPILIDMSSSITTVAMSQRLWKAGQEFPGDWAVDAEGHATRDPSVPFNEPKGALLPTGGMNHGHKGYGLALMIEALTQGLGGYGRIEAPAKWGCSVTVQVMNTAAFAGQEAFAQQMQHTAEMCRASRPVAGNTAVRLPGERELGLKKDYLANGVVLADALVDGLKQWCEKFDVAFV